MKLNRSSVLCFLLVSGLAWSVTGCTDVPENDLDLLELPIEITRTWIGPAYWTNPMQDWRLHDGRIENIRPGGNRSVHLLTHQIAGNDGSFNLKVVTGLMAPNEAVTADTLVGWSGFRIGIEGWRRDFRQSLIFGSGLGAGITTDNRLFIGSQQTSLPNAFEDPTGIELELHVEFTGEKTYSLQLSAAVNGAEIGLVELNDVPASLMTGNIALVSSSLPPAELDWEGPWNRESISEIEHTTSRRGQHSFWFRNWQVSGDKIKVSPEHAFGPILFSMYSFDQGVLKITAQMAPVSPNQNDQVYLDMMGANASGWTRVDSARIDALSRTATFRVVPYEADADRSFRIVYQDAKVHSARSEFVYDGTIRREPINKNELVIGGLSCNLDIAFPNTELIRGLSTFDPDILTFLGDQIYEPNGGFGNEPYADLEIATLDYLRKWILFGWSFRDLMRDRPTINLLDDHDVYHGNIWGAGGKATPDGLRGAEAQDQGGFKMPAVWVNMVQRTQTAHMPDPYDPSPVEQGIGVYYTDFVYGGISFAAIEDRKFKSAPKVLLPAADIWNGWPQNQEFDVRNQSDVSGAELLGERQMQFLGNWIQDWSGRAQMKVLLSQSIFTNLATLPAGSTSDAIVPSLRVYEENEYPHDDKPVTDFDSNGWPQSERDHVVDLLRRGFVLHVAGDQHLGSTLQYGIDDWGDGGYAICVPAIANIWPRRWMPDYPGIDPYPSSPLNTGKYEDGFGNKVTVHAIGNPTNTGRKPENVFDRAPGYGIIIVNKSDKTYRLENWPISENPGTPDAKPFTGWPITIGQMENNGRSIQGWLPNLQFEGVTDPVVSVFGVDASLPEYSLRVSGEYFQPFVFRDGFYRVVVSDPDLGFSRELTGLKSEQVKQPDASVLVTF